MLPGAQQSGGQLHPFLDDILAHRHAVGLLKYPVESIPSLSISSLFLLHFGTVLRVWYLSLQVYLSFKKRK